MPNPELPAETLAALGPQSRDPIFFAEEILGVRLNPAQKRWFRLASMLKPGSNWEWLYRRVVHVAANQIGKTLGLAILILWACHTKMGQPNTNWDAWFSGPFRWYHLAPTHAQALLTMKDMRSLMEGSHPAQIDKETGERRPARWAGSLWQDIKFDGVYPGFRLWNGAEIHFRTTDEKAKALQGVVAHGVSIDEAAFEAYLKEVLDQAVKLRLVSTGGPVWLVSTPDGINDYFEVVSAIQSNGIITFHERVWESPETRSALVWSHITDNIGYGLTQEEVDFLEKDVDPATKEQQLRGAFLAPLDAFFVPQSSILKAWDSRLPDSAQPQNNHKYAIFWDPSVSMDPTVLIVLDVTKKPYRGVLFKRWETPMGIHALLAEMKKVHAEWNTMIPRKPGFAPRAITGFDSTSMGGTIIRQELDRMTPKRPTNFGGKAKMKMLANARAAMSRLDVLVPASWLRLQRETLGYRIDDTKLVQDAIMCFIGALDVASSGFGGVTHRPFNTGYKMASAGR